jgi:hypothetical protein
LNFEPGTLNFELFYGYDEEKHREEGDEGRGQG